MKAKEIIINDILEELKSGVAPWNKPWFSIGKCNLETGHIYRGINTLLLASSEDQFYLTFKQVQALGGSVKAGSKGRRICFWNWLIKKDETSGKETKIPSVKYYVIFGLSQLELPEDKKEKLIAKRTLELKENKINMNVEEFISATKADIRHTDKSRAYYSPAFDFINIPELGQFENSDLYYKTLFHELTHWTGHEKRCARDMANKKAAFGSEDYAKEELIAEIGSSFLAAEFDIDLEVKNTAAYINGWMQAIRSDKNFIFSAASKAEKALEYLKQLVK